MSKYLLLYFAMLIVSVLSSSIYDINDENEFEFYSRRILGQKVKFIHKSIFKNGKSGKFFPLLVKIC